MGVSATIQRITAHYHWPGITGYITHFFVRSCPQCQKVDQTEIGVLVTLGETPVTVTPSHRVAVDIVGPLPLTEKRKHLRNVATSTDHLMALSIAEVDATEDLAIEYPLKSSETYIDVAINPKLSTDRQGQVIEVVAQHQAVLTDIPGQTPLVEVTMTFVTKQRWLKKSI